MPKPRRSGAFIAGLSRLARRLDASRSFSLPGARGLVSNAAHAEGMGAFPGLFYETTSGSGFTWLRDGAWTHAQRYSADDSDVLVTDMTNTALGLGVTAWNFVMPDRNVLVNHYVVTRDRDSPVRRATLGFYTNFSPSLARLPFFPIADWGLDFETGYALAYDGHERALLHFLPAS